MKKNVFSLYKILVLLLIICLAFTSCYNNPQQDQPNTDIHEINNQENEDENKDDFLSEDNFSE